MLRLLWVIFFLLLILHSTFSQNPFKAGISAGLALTQIDGDGYAGFDKVGAVLGGFVNNSFGSEKWSGQLELQYIEKGSRRPANAEKNVLPYKISLSYIEIPMVVKYKFKAFFYEAGVSYGRMFRHQEFDISGEVTNPYPFKNSELAILGGISYFITANISLNLRYSRSVLPVRDQLAFLPLSQFGFFGLTGGIFGGSFNTVAAFTLRYQFGKTEEMKKSENNPFKEILKIE